MYIPVPGLGDSAYLRTVFSFNDNKLINNRRIDPKFNISKTKQKNTNKRKTNQYASYLSTIRWSNMQYTLNTVSTFKINFKIVC